MKMLKFTKMVASGNDFVVSRPSHHPSVLLKRIARKICDRKFGVGADGLLVLGKSGAADIKMRIFNADGSEAEMCGNGARCVALWAKSKILKIQTKAGIINAQVKRGNVIRIKLTDPHDIKLDIPVRINDRDLKVNFVDTGVPHAVIFVEGLDNIDVRDIGRSIRQHKKFAPRGTNVDFVEVLNKDAIRIRTYERGVEDETLACGTGAGAASVIFALKSNAGNKISVHTKSGEVLKVYFDKIRTGFNNVWLEGRASIVFTGEFRC